MTIVSTRDFRANQTKYVVMAMQGHDVILHTHRGSVRLTPIEEERPKRNVTAEICEGMREWKKYLECLWGFYQLLCLEFRNFPLFQASR